MSNEAKFRLRIIFLVVVVFLTVMLTALYASLLLQQQKQFANNLTSKPTGTTVSANFVTEQLKLEVIQKNGVTTYSGEIAKPTPCHKIETNSEQSGTAVLLKFKTVESTSDLICAQVITFERVNGNLPANTDVTKIKVSINDTEITKKN